MFDTQEIATSSTYSLFERLCSSKHEQIVFCQDEKVNLRAIIAIHSTELGPAIGGVRLWRYTKEEEAIEDAMRLSRGMTYKAALAGLNLGGGKAVIIGDPSQKDEFFLRKFGTFVQTLGGRYWTAEDVNMSSHDMDFIRMETPYVVGVSEEMGGSGDPSSMTAYGVFIGMKAAAKRVYGNDALEGKRIVVQGIGQVGNQLVELLLKDGAKVLIADIDKEKTRTLTEKHPRVKTIASEQVYEAKADIFSPCALGGGLSAETIPQLKCTIVAGAANNQLQEELQGSKLLTERGILYVPDFMINAGGLINVYYEYRRMYNRKLVKMRIEQTYQTITKVFDLAESAQISVHESALKVAEERISKVRELGRTRSAHNQ